MATAATHGLSANHIPVLWLIFLVAYFAASGKCIVDLLLLTRALVNFYDERGTCGRMELCGVSVGWVGWTLHRYDD